MTRGPWRADPGALMEPLSSRRPPAGEAESMERMPGTARRAAMGWWQILIPLGVFALWLLLQTVILPRLGVQT